MKYKLPECPVCHTNTHVNTNGNGSSSGCFGNGTFNGTNYSSYYCSNCFCDFEIRISFNKMAKDKRNNISGHTGFTG